jgi:hypothetical protein
MSAFMSLFFQTHQRLGFSNFTDQSFQQLLLPEIRRSIICRVFGLLLIIPVEICIFPQLCTRQLLRQVDKNLFPLLYVNGAQIVLVLCNGHKDNYQNVGQFKVTHFNMFLEKSKI